MSISKDTDAAATPAAPAADAAASEQQISLSLPAPAAIEAPAITAAAATPASEAAKPIEMPKIIEMPRSVEAVMKAVEAMKPAAAIEAPVAPLAEQAAAAPVAPPQETPEHARSNRFALLAASVAFAGALGAMAGALGTSVVARSGPGADTPLAMTDVTSVRDAIASLRTELGAIKSSVESSNRNASAQFAKFTERLERIDRAAPAAQLKQALDAIDRLEKRAQAQGDVTGSTRPQTAAATPAAEPPRQRVIEGWTVRQVSRGVAVIQGRRIGAFEVEAGDVVPGVGRIESIRRQDGRWVVLTSNGMITSPTPSLPR